MRSTLDLDEKLIKEAQKLSGVKTKTELINLSLEEFIRHMRIDNLKDRFGKKPILLTKIALNKFRKDE